MILTKKRVRWIPSILSLGFVAFLSLFSLDVFSQYSGLNVVLPLLIHLIPSLLLIGITAIAWKLEWVGTLVYWGFAVWYISNVGFSRPVSWYLGIALPAFIVGTLYLMSWLLRRRVRK